MSAQDEVMERVGTAMALFHGGDRAGARRSFALIWDDVGPDGDAFHRCVLAHYRADALGDDDYGKGIRAALTRLANRLSES